ncbi:hypothetical protein R3P38DRAFT_3182806 [Favolaschia claudopus]|uniref:Uncharacterized protein n=1 Tax=Favolaschia claudopus TaxID=2862362 RepID=A0AAW0CDT6_9AGAR
MSDPNRCVEETYVDDNGRTICKSCRHIASAHPSSKPNITSFVKSFVDKTKQDTSKPGSSSTTKASQEEAAAETSAGLRSQKKRKSDSSEAGPSSKKANKGTKVKEEKQAGRDVKYAKAVLVVCGLKADGTLRNAVTPSREEINGKLKVHQLAVYTTLTTQLIVNTGWTNKEADAEVHRLFPEPMAFLQKMHPGEPHLWRVASSFKNRLTVDPELAPTGLEIANSCLVPGRTSTERIIYFATAYKIASRHWDWVLSESSELGSDVDTLPSEHIIHAVPKPKPAYKGKGKGKAIEVKQESSNDEDESDMRRAAKLRTVTRLASGAIKRKPLLIPEEPEVTVIDDDEDFPASVPLPETHGSASPHASVPPTSASPTFTSLDLENDDVPNFYEDFVTHATAEDLQPSTSTGIASSSSSAPSTSAFVATFSTWAPPPPPPPVTVPAQGPTPALAVTPSAPLLNDDEGESVYYMPPPPRLQVPPTSHRFQRMGKGRGN